MTPYDSRLTLAKEIANAVLGRLTRYPDIPEDLNEDVSIKSDIIDMVLAVLVDSDIVRRPYED